MFLAPCEKGAFFTAWVFYLRPCISQGPLHCTGVIPSTLRCAGQLGGVRSFYFAKDDDFPDVDAFVREMDTRCVGLRSQ